MNKNTNSIKDILAKDKRKYERLSLDLQAWYAELPTRIDPSPDWVGPFRIANICGDGVSFGVDRKLSEKTILNIKLHIPHDDEPITCIGRVMWCKDNVFSGDDHGNLATTHIIGMQFHKIFEPDQKRFITYIHDNILEKYL